MMGHFEGTPVCADLYHNTVEPVEITLVRTAVSVWQI